MARKITRKTKRRLLLITFITSVILFAFVINLWKMFSQVISKNKEAVFLRSEIERLEEEEAYLKIEVEKLNDPEYVARYARERFLYSKDGEFTIKIPETH
ncbi:MAG: septum formation initiator family protein [Bacilli bacterium]|nr:septum formation initiator family protein [Bacilli bacterium]MDD4298021.1 septum formation initiator family protein [Bacilli bacterium]